MDLYIVLVHKVFHSTLSEYHANPLAVYILCR